MKNGGCRFAPAFYKLQNMLNALIVMPDLIQHPEHIPFREFGFARDAGLGLL